MGKDETSRLIGGQGATNVQKIAGYFSQGGKHHIFARYSRYFCGWRRVYRKLGKHQNEAAA
jgi:hypothetical protein